MNFRRGFFRLWILLSAVWLFIWVVAGAAAIGSAFSYWKGTSLIAIEVKAASVERNLQFPLSASSDQITKAVELFREDVQKDMRSKSNHRNIFLFPDYRPKTQNLVPSMPFAGTEKVDKPRIVNLTRALEKAVERENVLWKAKARVANADFIRGKERLRVNAEGLLGGIAFVIFVPTLLLIIGTAIGWTLRGFKAP